MHTWGIILAIVWMPAAILSYTVGSGRHHRSVKVPRTSFDRFMGQQRTKMVPKPGWWQASDSKWYPPEQHPDYRPPPRGRRP
jgi:hypothetical protein